MCRDNIRKTRSNVQPLITMIYVLESMRCDFLSIWLVRLSSPRAAILLPRRSRRTKNRVPPTARLRRVDVDS